jgi:hypothetical protein
VEDDLILIEVKPLQKDKIEGGTVSIDDNFLNLSYMQKRYVTDRGKSIKIPPAPHSHDFEEFFVLVYGEAKLAYKDSKGNIEKLDMDKERRYHVSANIPHQAMVSDGILEVYFPKFDPSTAKIDKFLEQYV